MLRSSVIVFACMSWSLAQDTGTSPANDLRGPAIGEVRDANGKPWLGAEVVLIARPLPHDPNAGELDRVVAKVDERGRFRAEVLRGRPYTVWAWGEANEQGRPASAVADRVFVQQPVVLKQERVLPVRDVVLEHCERWEGFTFRVRVVDATWNRDVHWLDVKDGRARLPWLVASSAQIELFAVRDGVVHPLMSSATPAATGDVTITVPERQRITCFAMHESGTPLADARILRSLGDAMYVVGTTDAAGKLAFDVAATVATPLKTFVMGNDGATGVFLRIGDALRGQGDVPAGAELDDLLCRAPTGQRTHARFLDAEGKPIPNLEIKCAGLAINRPTRSSGMYVPWSTTLYTDANGAVALPATPNQPAYANVLLRERDLAALPTAWRRGLVPVVFAPFAAATGCGTEAFPFVVAPQQMCPVDFAFVGDGDTPVANVEVALATLTLGKFTSWPRGESCAISDERGRIRLLVPASQHLGLSATSGMSMLIRAFETTAARIDAEPATATLRVPRPTGIRGRLLDKAGAPASDRLLHASFGTDNTPAQWDYASEPESVLKGSKGNALRILLPNDQRESLMLTNLIGMPVPTDSEGRFALPLPAVRIPGLLLFNKLPSADSWFDSQPVEWTGEPIDDLEVRVRF